MHLTSAGGRTQGGAVGSKFPARVTADMDSSNTAAMALFEDWEKAKHFSNER